MKPSNTYVIVHQWSDGSFTVMPSTFRDRAKVEEWANDFETRNGVAGDKYYVALVGDNMKITVPKRNRR